MKKNPGFLYGAIASVFWATFYIVGRYIFGNSNVDPLYLTFLCFSIAVLFLMFILGFNGKIKKLLTAIRVDFPLFFILGASGILGQGFLVLSSLKYTTAARSCLFANASPFFTIVFSYLVIKEVFNKRKILGIFIGLGGVTLALLSKGSSDIFLSSKLFLRGDMFALLSAICWAIYTVFGKRAVSKYGGFITTTGAILFGNVMLFFIGLALVFWAIYLIINKEKKQKRARKLPTLEASQKKI